MGGYTHGIPPSFSYIYLKDGSPDVGGFGSRPPAGRPRQEGRNRAPHPHEVKKQKCRSTLPGITMPGEFELINLILDFAPDAATPLHTHGGPGIVTVLDGEMVFGVQGQLGAAQTGELPPGPTTVHRATLPGLTMPGEFDVINLILDFAPGAATPAHTHGGPGIVTVLEGTLTFGVPGQPDQILGPGGVYADLPGTAHTAANKTALPARVSYAVLLPKGP
jgi:quercetin dioxygenase-like cupin family protein